MFADFSAKVAEDKAKKDQAYQQRQQIKRAEMKNIMAQVSNGLDRRRGHRVNWESYRDVFETSQHLNTTELARLFIEILGFHVESGHLALVRKNMGFPGPGQFPQKAGDQ